MMQLMNIMYNFFLDVKYIQSKQRNKLKKKKLERRVNVEDGFRGRNDETNDGIFRIW